MLTGNDWRGCLDASDDKKKKKKKNRGKFNVVEDAVV